MKILTQHLLILLVAANLTGCRGDNSHLLTNKQTMRIDQDLGAGYVKPATPIEEYVSRIGKKIILVSDQSDAVYIFHVTDEANPELLLDKANNSVTLSRGLLHELNDEAELAAILGLSISKLAYYPDIDRSTIKFLTRAGYDPRALVDLQQHYYEASASTQNHWLSTIYKYPPTVEALEQNKAFTSKAPKGLQRGVENYQKQITE